MSSLSDSTGTLESYDYLGEAVVVARKHPQPGVDLSYIKRAGEANGDAGDPYTGLDRFGRIVDQRWLRSADGSAVDRLQHTYDRNGNRLSRTNLIDAAFSESYSYDNLNQLVGFTRGSHTRSWDYDAQGNWQSVTTNGSTQTRSHNAQNEITSISGATTPTYDANGNLTRDETGRQFVYDAWNRLVAVKDAGGTTLKSYAYDGQHRRISETAGGTTTDLHYSAAWQVLEERVASGGTSVPRVQYVWSPVYVDALILRDRDTNGDGTLDERLYVVQDANYNVVALFDNSGNVVERYAYDPFGHATVLDANWNALAASAFGWLYLHQGGRLDATSGLYHFLHRDYSPTLGRWTSLDPIRYEAGDVNLYRALGNGPTNRLDPSGLDDKPPLPPIHKLPSCMACHGDLGILTGSKRLEDLNPWQLNTMQRWNAGSYFPRLNVESKMTQEQELIIGAAKGNEAAEKELGLLLNLALSTRLAPSLPILSYFWPDTFGNHCVRWTNKLQESLCRLPADKFGKNVIIRQYTLRYPRRGGPEHSIILVKIKGKDVVVGIDNGSFGGDTHVFDPAKVIGNTSLPQETRDDLQDALKEFRGK